MAPPVGAFGRLVAGPGGSAATATLLAGVALHLALAPALPDLPQIADYHETPVWMLGALAPAALVAAALLAICLALEPRLGDTRLWARLGLAALGLFAAAPGPLSALPAVLTGAGCALSLLRLARGGGIARVWPLLTAAMLLGALAVVAADRLLSGLILPPQALGARAGVLLLILVPLLAHSTSATALPPAPPAP